MAGFENHVRETNLTIALQNVAEEDVEKILETIEETLKKVVEEGFEEEKIEAILHSYELSLKHKSASFGMNLIMSMTPYWNHAESPLDYLEVNKTVKWFRATLAADPTFLQDLVSTHLLANPHKLVQTMVPKPEHQEQEEQQFKALEVELGSKLKEEDKKELIEKCTELAKQQDAVEDASCLPSLKVLVTSTSTCYTYSHICQVSDIPLCLPSTEIQQLVLQGVKVQLAEQPTNEVSSINFSLQLRFFFALLGFSTMPTPSSRYHTSVHSWTPPKYPPTSFLFSQSSPRSSPRWGQDTSTSGPLTR